MLWLCLRFPELPLEMLSRAIQNTAEQAWIIVEEQRVAFCNQAARSGGIGAGMSITTAYALGKSLRVIDRDHEREQATLAQLAQWAYRFTPTVSIKTPNTLLLETGATLKLFRGLPPILQHIEEDLDAQGFSYRLGIADTPKAAWLLAHNSTDGNPGGLDAHHQQRRREPLSSTLASLPLQLLDCPPATLTRLQKPGFKTLGELLALPRAALGKRFGRDFIHYLERVLGEVPDPQITIEPEKRFRHALPFIDPIHRSETLLFPMQRLLDELARFLLSRQLDCSTFSWELEQQDADTTVLPIQLSRPRHDRDTFLSLTRTRLDTFKLQAPVTALTLDCHCFSHSEHVSEQLFDDSARRDRQSMEELLDKLRARLQQRQIYTLACRGEYVPELAWRRLPPGQKTRTETAEPAPNRPGWLLQRPSPIHRRGGELYWRGELKLILGPERIDTLWWRRPVKRDYFVARHEGGGLYWVFLDHQRGHWYIHGIFS